MDINMNEEKQALAEKQLNLLKEYLAEYMEDGICIAFSGGTDSSLLLKAACDLGKEAGIQVHAVIFQTKLHPAHETGEAVTLAKKFGAEYRAVEIDEFSDPLITANPLDRCYRCKSLLFRKLWQIARELGCECVMDGSNFDDTKEYRPGLLALKELKVLSPLMELKFTKQQVRHMSELLSLETAQKPSAPCLATRLPYGTPFDYKMLERIARGEAILKSYGFCNVRLRLHGTVVRIEIDPGSMEDFMKRRLELAASLKQLGFVYLTLDLEGFRSGSMDLDTSAPSG